MRHPFMEAISEELASQSIATFRYQFPYMEQGGGRPDPPAVLVATVRAAVQAATEAAPDLPLLAGGKSLGGRMTSTAASQSPLPGVQGIVFFGFPLHPPGTTLNRACPTPAVRHRTDAVPSRHARQTGRTWNCCARCAATSGSRAQLHIIEGADHSFSVLKRSGRNDRDVLQELGSTVAEWADRLQNGATAV